jgi:2-polyprenyl-6-methoxyphenol hydroxylase-like FAD-dependent oxidoreductase
MLFRRQKLLELLYDSLPEKEQRVFTKKRVISIDNQDYGVTVRCSDGMSVEGSVVVGCDGVHSTVRQAMGNMMLQSSVMVADSDEPMVVHYQLLTGHTDRIQEMEPRRIWETRFDGMSIQSFMLENEGWFLVYKRLPKPIIKSTKYTNEDAEAFANSIMNCHVSSDKEFKDLWAARRWFRLLDLEEGCVKTWHWGRMVLVGDSVHKMTPNSGLGLNQGWQGVAALTNSLRQLLAVDPAPDTKALEKAFAVYKDKTEQMAKDSMLLSSLYTRITAWHNPLYKAADYVSQYVGGDIMLIRLLASPIIRKGIVLDFLPEKGLIQGNIKWKNVAPP